MTEEQDNGAAQQKVRGVRIQLSFEDGDTGEPIDAQAETPEMVAQLLEIGLAGLCGVLGLAPESVLMTSSRMVIKDLHEERIKAKPSPILDPRTGKGIRK